KRVDRVDESRLDVRVPRSIRKSLKGDHSGWHGRNPGSERHPLGRVFRLLQRQVGTGSQQPWQQQPQQLALERRRREAAGTRLCAGAVALMCVALAADSRLIAQPATARTFATPEDAVRALTTAAAAPGPDELLAI